MLLGRQRELLIVWVPQPGSAADPGVLCLCLRALRGNSGAAVSQHRAATAPQPPSAARRLLPLMSEALRRNGWDFLHAWCPLYSQGRFLVPACSLISLFHVALYGWAGVFGYAK